MNESFTNSIIGSEAFDKNIVLNRVIFLTGYYGREYLMLSGNVNTGRKT